MEQCCPAGKADSEQHALDNPALSAVIERNIRTIINFCSLA
jgi:hypothetical protein